MRRRTESLIEDSADMAEGEGREPLKTHVTAERKAVIKLEDGTLIKGKINILAEPAQEYHDVYCKHSDARGTFYERISDIFTKGRNPFVVVFDVTTEGQAGNVLIINKNKILWISPEE